MADKMDYMRAGIFVVAFICLGLWKLQTWLVAETLMVAFSGVGLLSFPSLSIKLQTNDFKLDLIHIHLNRVFGSYLIGLAVFSALCLRSKDIKVTGALLWSKFLGILPLLVIIGYGHLHYKKIFTDKHLWFGLLGNSLWWMANTFQLIKLRPAHGPYIQTRAITLVSHLNILYLTILSIGTMAFPGLFTLVKGKSLDGFHLHTARAAGSLALCWNILAWNLPTFRFRRDVRSFFFSQIVLSTVIQLSIGYLVYVEETIKINDGLLWASIHLPFVLIGVCGLMSTIGLKEDMQPLPVPEDKKKD